MTSPQARIYWTAVELNTVARAWISICDRNHDSYLSPNRPLSQIILEAQQILPSTRWRPKASLMGTKNLNPIFDEIERIKLTPPTIQPVHQPEVEEEVRPEEQVVQIEVKNAFIPAINTDQSLEDIMMSFAQAIARTVTEMTMKEMRKGFAREFPKLLNQAQQLTNNQPKILVIGPLGRQQEELEQAVDGLAELKFVSSEESPRLIKSRSHSCVAAILWSSFVSHSHQDAVMKAFSREAVRIISGTSIQKVKSALEDLALQINEA